MGQPIPTNTSGGGRSRLINLSVTSPLKAASIKFLFESQILLQLEHFPATRVQSIENSNPEHAENGACLTRFRKTFKHRHTFRPNNGWWSKFGFETCRGRDHQKEAT